MNSKEKNKNDQSISYPRPSPADEQLKNQPEFLDAEPNSFKEVSEKPKEESSSETDDEK
jgi:hypothetical protein